MKIKKLAAMVLSASMAAGMMCAMPVSAADIIIQIGHSDTKSNLIHTSLEHFKEYVEEKTDGLVEVDLYASEVLGTNAEMAEMVEMGTLSAMMMPQGQEAVYAPKLSALGLPFLFNSYDSVYAVLDGEIGEEMLEGLEEHNMIQLAYWENGLRQITNSQKAIETPEDLAGLKIRTPEDEMTTSIFEALGAEPSPLAFSLLYDALQDGTFDGQENPIANIHASSFQDVQKYLTIMNHKYECKNLVFSRSIFDSYPEEVQKVLTEAAQIFGEEHRSAVADGQDAQLAELEAAGMEVNYPDTAAFQEATASVYDDFYAANDWAEDLVSRIQDVVASVDGGAEAETEAVTE